MTTVEAFIAANRFGLGARPGELAEIARDPRGWVLGQVVERPPLPPEFADLPSAADGLRVLFEARRADGAAGIAKAFREQLGERARDEVAARTLAMVRSPHPFRERLVAFWSNHFTVSATRAVLAPVIGPYEREAIRPHLFGSFEDMLLAVVRHPVMLSYLDNIISFGPESPVGRHARRGLNENLAREILELHTLGVDGGYTQSDVTEFAKILTGWSHGGVRRQGVIHGEFEFKAMAHEPGAKRLLGRHYPEDGEREGIAALKDLARHPSTARFVATKLARHFVADEPPPEAIDRLAGAFRDGGGDLAAVYRALVSLDALWREPLPKVKTPYELVVSTFRAAAFDDFGRLTPKRLLGILAQLGHIPFRAPSPAGWPDAAAEWLSPQALMRRIEWTRAVVALLPRELEPGTLMRETIGPVASAETMEMVAAAPSREEGRALVLASREFQRR